MWQDARSCADRLEARHDARARLGANQPREAKICELQMSGRIDEQVVRLDVAVEEAERVHDAHRNDKLAHVKEGLCLGQHAPALQQREHVAAGYVLLHEPQVARVLEALVQPRDPLRAIAYRGNLGERLPLGVRARHLRAHAARAGTAGSGAHARINSGRARVEPRGRAPRPLRAAGI